MRITAMIYHFFTSMNLTTTNCTGHLRDQDIYLVPGQRFSRVLHQERDPVINNAGQNTWDKFPLLVLSHILQTNSQAITTSAARPSPPTPPLPSYPPPPFLPHPSYKVEHSVVPEISILTLNITLAGERGQQ